MKITLKNKELLPSITLMQMMELKSSDSRHRSKFIKLLSEAKEAYVEANNDLLESLGVLASDGSIKKEVEEDKSIVIYANKEIDILANEEIVIEGGMFVKNITEIPRILHEFEGELSGQNAEIYDRLLDEFEKVDNLKGEK